MVRKFMYPAILKPQQSLDFSCQYAFRPTGSTTSALIAILHSVTDLLSSNPYVGIIALDFSKAFDTVRHSELLRKLAMLDIPDEVFNWMVDFFSGRSHCTSYRGETSELLDISASIIQGSAVGPVSYVINAADLTTVTDGNQMHKYADDTYILIPSCNIHSRETELKHVEQWASTNNLKLNRTKSLEVIFTSSRRKLQECDLPTALPDIARATAIKILGVTITNHLSVSEHVRDIIGKCAQTMHALKILRRHGMSQEALRIVYKAVALAKLTYAAPAWWGFASADDRKRLEAFVRRGVRLDLYTREDPTISELVKKLDDTLFQMILDDEAHVIHYLLPPATSITYYLRQRRHNRQLTTKADDRNFITRKLYEDVY